MSRYKAVIVGCGGRGPGHAKAYDHIANADVTACCNRGEARRVEMAERFGLRSYADAAEMIREEKPDIVHLVTGPTTRVDLMTLVSDLRVPMCTVEKPLAINVPDWRALVALEAKTATKFAVCHQFRWHTDLMRCQDAVNAGRIGPVRFVHMSSGMNIMGQGTHTLNYGFSIIGDPRVSRVYGNVNSWDNRDLMHPAPLSSEALLTFDNGVQGLWTSGPVSPRYGDPEQIYMHVHVEAFGEKGRVNYEEFGRWDVVADDGRGESGVYDPDARDADNAMAQARFHEALMAWHEGGGAPGTSLEQSLHESAVVLALYQSALENRPMAMADFDPPDDLVDQVVARA